MDHTFAVTVSFSITAMEIPGTFHRSIAWLTRSSKSELKVPSCIKFFDEDIVELQRYELVQI